MSRMGAEGWKNLEAMGVRVVCDLRRRDEREVHAVCVPDGVAIELKWWSFDDAAIQAGERADGESERMRPREKVRKKWKVFLISFLPTKGDDGNG